MLNTDQAFTVHVGVKHRLRLSVIRCRSVRQVFCSQGFPLPFQKHGDVDLTVLPPYRMTCLGAQEPPFHDATVDGREGLEADEKIYILLFRKTMRLTHPGNINVIN
jgi:hypothetical protein